MPNPSPVIGKFPNWKVQDGKFLPFFLKKNAFVNHVQAQLQTLDLPKECSIYIRGSRIEDANHHPLADIDLIVLSPFECIEDVFSKLTPWMEQSLIPIDIRKKTPSRVHVDPHIRLLLHTRSIHIFGERHIFHPVPANLETMQKIFHDYAYYQFPPILRSGFQLRLLQLKLLTRSFGCIGFLQGHPFTRDVATCIHIAKSNDRHVGLLLEEYWERICEEQPLSEFNILPIIELLLKKERASGLLC